jgi:pyruvate/2-oxoglutarate dehydrogenase complex dihydrolipoamide acyltransferase (E2) component
LDTPIVLPDLGIQPVRLSVWFADPGDEVYEGDRLIEVLVNGATFDVPAPVTGRLTEQRALMDETVYPGQILGILTSEIAP